MNFFIVLGILQYIQINDSARLLNLWTEILVKTHVRYLYNANDLALSFTREYFCVLALDIKLIALTDSLKLLKQPRMEFYLLDRMLENVEDETGVHNSGLKISKAAHRTCR